MILKGNVYSKVLDMETGITVISPQSRIVEKPYKVMYLLHGLCGSSANFCDYTMLPFYAWESDAMFILPEVQRSFYTDMKYGLKYFTYITEELPKICANHFRISAEREDTYIGGVSMGGYGALKCALSKPEQYNACCAIAPAALNLRDFLNQLEQGDFGKKHPDLAAVYGEKFEWESSNDIMELYEKAILSGNVPKVYHACGTEDFLYDSNYSFSKIISKTNADYKFESWVGEHDFKFFNQALSRALKEFKIIG